jgi:hypothetical protein
MRNGQIKHDNLARVHRGWTKVLAGAVVCATGVLVSGVAYATTTTTTTSNLVPVNNNPGLRLTGAGAAVFVAVIIGLFVLLLFGPVVYGALSSARQQRRLYRLLAKSIESPKGQTQRSSGDVKTILEAFGKLEGSLQTGDGQSGGQSLTTSLIALATLTLVGLALVLLFVSSSSDAVDLRKTIITALLSILASISGFYFGARTAQVSAKQAQSSTDGTSSPTFAVATPPNSVPSATPYSYDFQASGSPAPTYRLVGAPPWLSIDGSKGSLSGTAPAAPGRFTFSVVASNSAGSATVGPFEVTIT